MSYQSRVIIKNIVKYTIGLPVLISVTILGFFGMLVQITLNDDAGYDEDWYFIQKIWRPYG